MVTSSALTTIAQEDPGFICSVRESPIYLLTRLRGAGLPKGNVHGFPLVLRGPHFPMEIIAAHRVRRSVEAFWRRLSYHGPSKAWSGGVGPGGEGLGTVCGWAGVTGGRTGAFPFACAGMWGGEGGRIAEPSGFVPEDLLFDGVNFSSDLVEHLVVGMRLHRGAGGPLVRRGGFLLGEEAMEETLDRV